MIGRLWWPYSPPEKKGEIAFRSGLGSQRSIPRVKRLLSRLSLSSSDWGEGASPRFASVFCRRKEEVGPLIRLIYARRRRPEEKEPSRAACSAWAIGESDRGKLSALNREKGKGERADG